MHFFLGAIRVKSLITITDIVSKECYHLLQATFVLSVGNVILMMTGNLRWYNVACVRAGSMLDVKVFQVG